MVVVPNKFDFGDWWTKHRNAIGQFGVGFAQGHNFGEGIALGGAGAQQGRTADDAYAAAEAEKAQREQQLNQTIQILQEKAPKLAQAVQNGLPLDQAWSTYLKGDSAGGAATFSHTPVFLVDDKGNQQAAQMSSAGGLFVNGKVLEGVPAGWKVIARPENFDSVNIGGSMSPFNPNTGTYGTGPAIQGTPSANMDVTAAPGGGRAMAPAVGSPQAIEQGGQAAAAATRTQQINERTDLVIGKVDEALGQVSWDSTGLVGQTMGNLAGTKAFDLRKTVDTVIANIGFSELQAMRAASPTGGALGQVAVQELEMLQSVLASLNADQSEQQMAVNLAQVKRLLERQKMFREEAAKMGAGSGGGGSNSGDGWTVIGAE